ncbi:pyridoxamine 5'-phosphate oxidase family protein [Anaeropeptidivorans aminofermentans]|uniref:pyridoxamine 5'-phosphate oxidase family protein n=1 Tax=Anaeropeptidivorans aminofermentans TaxID=2934315 RepID=UPI00202551AC|nr:pyridoxamine 5'-phosphate oxidase family protein [Anaeropeptidivorans aminofermentans]
MYQNMRRSDRQISKEETMEILLNGEYGFLATVDKDNQPYVVPLSYVVIENEIFFHCALSGQKLDNIKHEEKVCFSVVGKTQPVYDNNFTTYFESVVVFGKARIIDDMDKKTEVLLKLAEKYLPEYMDMADKAIEGSMQRTAICAITIDHITGKAKKKKV